MRRPSQSAAQQEAIVASFEVHVSYQLDLAPQALAAVTCSAGQEIFDQPCEFRRLFDLRHVTAILDDGEPRAWNGTLIDLATLDWRNRVLASPHAVRT
jgi:hypothetical protein